MTFELDDVKEAARWLATSDKAPEAFEHLEALVRTVPNRPVKLTGPAAILNPLLDAYREDRATYDTVVQWAASKRALANLPPFKEDDTGFDKTQYMREFMQSKRVRERQAVEIENMLRPDRDKLRGRTRMDFLQVMSRKWKVERDQMLETARSANSGTLSREQMQQVLAQFWERIDSQLQAQYDANDRKLRNL